MCRECMKEEQRDGAAEVGRFFLFASVMLTCLGAGLWYAQDPEYRPGSVALLPIFFGVGFFAFAVLCGLRWLALTIFRR